MMNDNEPYYKFVKGKGWVFGYWRERYWDVQVKALEEDLSTTVLRLLGNNPTAAWDDDIVWTTVR